jgi:hypothetical protein
VGIFGAHAITLVANAEKAQEKAVGLYGEIYDASYGAVGKTIEVKNDNQNEIEKALQNQTGPMMKWQEENIVGFCGFNQKAHLYAKKRKQTYPRSRSKC